MFRGLNINNPFTSRNSMLLYRPKTKKKIVKKVKLTSLTTESPSYIKEEHFSCTEVLKEFISQ